MELGRLEAQQQGAELCGAERRHDLCFGKISPSVCPLLCEAENGDLMSAVSSDGLQSLSGSPAIHHLRFVMAPLSLAVLDQTPLVEVVRPGS